MAVSPPAPASIQKLAATLKVLAEPNRLRIFDVLMQGIYCNCELGDALGMAPNLISYHLSVLHRAGLVEAEHDPADARWIYYAINRAALEDLHRAFAAFFDPTRIQPRQPNCGPSTSTTQLTDVIDTS